MDPIHLYQQYCLIHPEHEDEVREQLSHDWRIQEWNRDHNNTGLSLSAFILHERQEKHHTGSTLFASTDMEGSIEWSNETLINIIKDSIYPEDYRSNKEYKLEIAEVLYSSRVELLERIWNLDHRGCESADPSYTRPEMCLLNGFITKENIHWIDKSDEYIFYDISIREFISVQDDLLTELLNAGLIHQCRGFDHTRALLFREETEEEASRWNKLTSIYEDDGLRGL